MCGLTMIKHISCGEYATKKWKKHNSWTFLFNLIIQVRKLQTLFNSRHFPGKTSSWTRYLWKAKFVFHELLEFMNLFMNKLMNSETESSWNLWQYSWITTCMFHELFISWTYSLTNSWTLKQKRFINLMHLFMNRYKYKYGTVKRQAEKYFKRTNNGNMIITEQYYFIPSLMFS